MCTLVIAAHPDDETLGCGGTIARLVNEGHEVYTAILGEGISSRYSKNGSEKKKLIKTLKDNAIEVANVLGMKEIFFYNLPDNKFDTVPLLDIIKIIEELLTRIRPEIIYTHHAGDLNIDHVIVHRAVMTATRPVVGSIVEEIYSFEIPSSTEWAFGQYVPAFNPNIFMDISTTIEIKLKAMSIYESENRSFPHPRSQKLLRILAQRRGSMVGLQVAEAFELIRSIR